MRDTIIHKARFDCYIKLYRLKEFRFFLPKIYGLPMEKDYDLQLVFASTVDDFNEIRNEHMASS